MKSFAVETAPDIERVVRSLLKQSKAWGIFPTPVDKIIQFAELAVDQGVDLSKIDHGFLSKFQFVPKFAKKILGILDYREKSIYLDQSQRPSKKNFVKLHEVTHNVLPWQKDLLGFMDDEQTLAAEVKEVFEREANFGASALLFQLERFEEEAEKFPLSINSPRALAEKFGGSVHAAIRRYAECSKKRCAVLVLHPPERNGQFSVRVRNYFPSPPFTAEFGDIFWPDVCTPLYPFVHDIKFKRRLHEKGQIDLDTQQSGTQTFNYHFFNNTFNSFVLIIPPGEKNRSRITIIEKP